MLRPCASSIRRSPAPAAPAVESELRALRMAQNSQARSGNFDRAAAPGEADSEDAAAEAQLARRSAELRSELNQLANRLQSLEFAADASLFEAAATDEGISVEYRLPSRIGLASRQDQQIVRIADMELGSQFVFSGTPVLSEYVYLEGTARNTSDVVLLEGPYTAYLDGRFVGRASLPMVGIGESFTVGYGIDSQLRVQRVLTDRTSQIQGGNEVTTFSYRLTVSNFKNEPVTLRLYDRRPVPQNADIRIEVTTPTEYPLSTDALYVRDRMPQGILRWDLTVPAGSNGADALQIVYSVRMEYDRSQQVVPR